MKTKMLPVVTLCFMLSLGVEQTHSMSTTDTQTAEEQAAAKKTKLIKLYHEHTASDCPISLENYCSQVLDLYYRSQLDEMLAQAKTENNRSLQTALETATKGIDAIGEPFYQKLLSDIEETGTPSIIPLIQSHEKQKLKIILNAKNTCHPTRFTALTVASRMRDLSSQSFLLNLKDESGQLLIDVNAQTKDGQTALYLACDAQNLEAVKNLLALPSVDVNKQDLDDKTALEISCSTPWYYSHESKLWPNKDIIQALLSRDAKPYPGLDLLQELYYHGQSEHDRSTQENAWIYEILTAYHMPMTSDIHVILELEEKNKIELEKWKKMA